MELAEHVRSLLVGAVEVGGVNEGGVNVLHVGLRLAVDPLSDSGPSGRVGRVSRVEEAQHLIVDEAKAFLGNFLQTRD